jgi:small subunit ribosomal protein S17
MVGKVVSTKMQNTAVVLVESVKTHPLYRKTYLRTKRFLVDDRIGVKDGDVVEVVKIKPISKNKHWSIVKVIGKDFEMIAKEELKEASQEIIDEVMPVEVEEVVTESPEVKEEVVEEKPKAKKTTAKKAKKGVQA